MILKIIPYVIVRDSPLVHVIVSSLMHNDVIKYSRVTGPMWRKSTSHQSITLARAIDTELWCFLWSVPEQTIEQTIKTPVIWDAIALIITSLFRCYEPGLNSSWWDFATVLHHRKSAYIWPSRLYQIILYIEYLTKTKEKTPLINDVRQTLVGVFHTDRINHFNNFGREQSIISNFKHTYLLTIYHPLDSENVYADHLKMTS